MRCPYIYNTVECIHQKEPRYNALDVENTDGTSERLHLTSNDTAYTRTRHFHDCLETDCAAWQNGRCVRTG
jgi:hypothetical protein